MAATLGENAAQTAHTARYVAAASQFAMRRTVKYTLQAGTANTAVAPSAPGEHTGRSPLFSIAAGESAQITPGNGSAAFRRRGSLKEYFFPPANARKQKPAVAR